MYQDQPNALSDLTDLFQFYRREATVDAGRVSEAFAARSRSSTPWANTRDRFGPSAQAWRATQREKSISFIAPETRPRSTPLWMTK